MKGQSATEWLLTHAWSIIIVLCLGLVLTHLGVFDTSATPRFEGFQVAGLQPLPDKVIMYFDGMMVLTVSNTKPYKINFEWVEISPLNGDDDTLRTSIQTIIDSGGIQTFEVNATNIIPAMESSLMMASDVEGTKTTVDFRICIYESYSAGGKSNEHKVCGKAKKIKVEKNSKKPKNKCKKDKDCRGCEVCDENGECQNTCSDSETCNWIKAEKRYVCELN